MRRSKVVIEFWMATSSGPTGGLLTQFVIDMQVLRAGIPMSDIGNNLRPVMIRTINK